MEMMQCPTCCSPLKYSRGQKSVSCERGHHFDEAKEGYLNLLMSHQKHSKQPGDSREMLLARQRFLERQVYLPLAERLAQLIGIYSGNALTSLVDIGCGEGYYLQQIANYLMGSGATQESRERVKLLGVDISKEAIRMAARRLPKDHFCVASSNQLPIQDCATQAILGVFSPLNYAECRRILQKGGYLYYVYPFGDHLEALKSLIYDGILKEKDYDKYLTPPPGFGLVLEEALRYQVSLSAEVVEDLLRMTPHFWKIRPELREKALNTAFPNLQIAMGIVVYQKLAD